MEYQVGKPGRIIAARLSEGEDLYECIEALAEKENINAAAVLITGGIRKGRVVVGSKQEHPTVEPDFRDFEGPGEILGVGTLYPKEGKPSLHIHTGIGKDGQTLVVCPRGGTSVFLILEITIIELEGITAARTFDPNSGLHLLRFQ